MSDRTRLKYTRRKNGEDMATVSIKVHVTREQVETLRGEWPNESIRKTLEWLAAEGIHRGTPKDGEYDD